MLKPNPPQRVEPVEEVRREIKNVSNATVLFENRIWSIEDVASYTGYSVGTLYNLTSQNVIPHRKKRGKLYFVPLEIQNWIDEGDTK